MRTAKRGTYYYYVNKYSGVSNIKESQGEVKVSQCGTPRRLWATVGGWLSHRNRNTVCA